MQVDQFESEVESLSVQTRKKKGDKEVGPPSRIFVHIFNPTYADLSLLCVFIQVQSRIMC